LTAKILELLIDKETGGSIPYLWKPSLEKDKSAPIGRVRNRLSFAADGQREGEPFPPTHA